MRTLLSKRDHIFIFTKSCRIFWLNMPFLSHVSFFFFGPPHLSKSSQEVVRCLIRSNASVEQSTEEGAWWVWEVQQWVRFRLGERCWLSIIDVLMISKILLIGIYYLGRKIIQLDKRVFLLRKWVSNHYLDPPGIKTPDLMRMKWLTPVSSWKKLVKVCLIVDGFMEKLGQGVLHGET